MRNGERHSGQGRSAPRVASEAHGSGDVFRRLAERIEAVAADCAPVVLGLLIAIAAAWLFVA